MRKASICVCVPVVLAAASCVCADTVVFSQAALSPDNPFGFQFSNAASGQAVADDVPAFGTAVTLSGIDWWGGSSTNQFTISIFEEDADFADGVAWFTQTGVVATTSSGRYGGETKYSYDFGSTVTLDAGKVYWFSIQHEGTTNDFGWSLADAGSNNALGYTSDIGDVGNFPWGIDAAASATLQNVAFELRESVVVPLPVPVWAGLGGLGLVGITCAVRKRR